MAAAADGSVHLGIEIELATLQVSAGGQHLVRVRVRVGVRVRVRVRVRVMVRVIISTWRSSWPLCRYREI